MVRPDYVQEISQDSETYVITQLLRIGPPRKVSKEDEFRFDLYDLALAEAYPKAKSLIQVVYMSGNEPMNIETGRNTQKSLELCARALRGVARGDFIPRPKEDRCPHCPGYFSVLHVENRVIELFHT